MFEFIVGGSAKRPGNRCTTAASGGQCRTQHIMAVDRHTAKVEANAQAYRARGSEQQAPLARRVFPHGDAARRLPNGDCKNNSTTSASANDRTSAVRDTAEGSTGQTRRD
jgi:hypothetical protein